MRGCEKENVISRTKIRGVEKKMCNRLEGEK